MCAALLLVAGCASEKGAVRLSDDDRLNEFLENVRYHVEDHHWEAILAAADSAHYGTQVREMGIPEPQYAAELFGLHNVDNDIGASGTIEWSDLNRIETLRLTSIEAHVSGQWTVRGVAVLDDGSRLDVQMLIRRGADGFRLTGGVG